MPLKAQGDLLLFCRELGEERVLIALNMGPEPIAVSFANKRFLGRVVLSSFVDREGEEVRCGIDLRGNEGLLVKFESAINTNLNVTATSRNPHKSF